MNIIEDFKFRVSVSREGYEDKNDAKMCLSATTARELGRQKMAFKEVEVSVEEFIDYAISGHAFCNLFRFEDKEYWVKSGRYKTTSYPIYKRGLNKGYFKLSFKKDEFFYGSQTIFVDIDYTHFERVEDYLNCLTYPPTCVYMSYSDKANKKGIVSRRFRLVYVFDSILSAEEFKNVTFALYDKIVEDTDEPMYDSCGCSYSQYMNGSNSEEVYISNVIYSSSDFSVVDVLEDETSKEEVAEELNISFNEELVNDMIYSPYLFVVEKWYAKGLRYIYKTNLDFGDSLYSTDTENFISLYFHNERVEDGCMRRKKLFMRAALRRLIKEDVSADELLYNLYIDRERFFDNSDGVLDIECLKVRVGNALNAELTEIKDMMKGFKKPTFIINPKVENKRQVIGQARREMTDSRIKELYNLNLSFKENLAVLGISKSRLYQYCKENGIDTKKAAKVGYNPDLSIRENMKAMGCSKYQVEKAKKAYK